MTAPRSTRDTVLAFIETVRSGADPERAAEFMAASIRAHQVCSE